MVADVGWRQVVAPAVSGAATATAITVSHMPGELLSTPHP